MTYIGGERSFSPTPIPSSLRRQGRRVDLGDGNNVAVSGKAVLAQRSWEAGINRGQAAIHFIGELNDCSRQDGGQSDEHCYGGRTQVFTAAMRLPTIFLAMACLSLGACSADYPLKAFFKDGKLYFDGAKEDWFFGRTGFCPRYFSVRSQSGETLWRIETDLLPSECELFPVAYGIAPKGWKAVVPARPLESGQLYVVNGQGGDSYHGAFRYREQRVLSVENHAELARQLPDPPYNWPPENAADE